MNSLAFKALMILIISSYILLFFHKKKPNSTTPNYWIFLRMLAHAPSPFLPAFCSFSFHMLFLFLKCPSVFLPTWKTNNIEDSVQVSFISKALLPTSNILLWVSFTASIHVSTILILPLIFSYTVLPYIYYGLFPNPHRPFLFATATYCIHSYHWISMH